MGLTADLLDDDLRDEQGFRSLAHPASVWQAWSPSQMGLHHLYVVMTMFVLGVGTMEIPISWRSSASPEPYWEPLLAEPSPASVASTLPGGRSDWYFER